MDGSGTRRWLRVALLIAGAAAFAAVLASADLGVAGHALAASGPLLLLGLLPYLFQVGLDALAWRTLLSALGHHLRWSRLFAIRLSTEAVLMSVPAGGLVGETLKIYLLHRSGGVPGPDTVASVGAKKCLLVLAQAVYLGVALAIGWSRLDGASPALIGGRGLPLIVAGVVAVFVLIAVLLSLAFVGIPLGAHLHRLLLRVPVPRFRIWIAARHEPFTTADDRFRALGLGPRAPLIAAFVALCLAWLVETLETALLLHLLGIEMRFADVLVMEACVVVMRNLAFFMPAGLGVQDAGYLAFLRALGDASASAAAGAFLIVKRAKEVVWVGVGYVALLLLPARGALAPVLPRALIVSATE